MSNIDTPPARTNEHDEMISKIKEVLVYLLVNLLALTLTVSAFPQAGYAKTDVPEGVLSLLEKLKQGADDLFSEDWLGVHSSPQYDANLTPEMAFGAEVVSFFESSNPAFADVRKELILRLERYAMGHNPKGNGRASLNSVRAAQSVLRNYGIEVPAPGEEQNQTGRWAYDKRISQFAEAKSSLSNHLREIERIRLKKGFLTASEAATASMLIRSIRACDEYISVYKHIAVECVWRPGRGINENYGEAMSDVLQRGFDLFNEFAEFAVSLRDLDTGSVQNPIKTGKKFYSNFIEWSLDVPEKMLTSTVDPTLHKEAMKQLAKGTVTVDFAGTGIPKMVPTYWMSGEEWDSRIDSFPTEMFAEITKALTKMPDDDFTLLTSYLETSHSEFFVTLDDDSRTRNAAKENLGQLAKTAGSRGDWESAFVYYTKIDEIDGRKKPSSDTAKAERQYLEGQINRLMDVGRGHESQGNYLAALDAFASALRMTTRYNDRDIRSTFTQASDFGAAEAQKAVMDIVDAQRDLNLAAQANIRQINEAIQQLKGVQRTIARDDLPAIEAERLRSEANELLAQITASHALIERMAKHPQGLAHDNIQDLAGISQQRVDEARRLTGMIRLGDLYALQETYKSPQTGVELAGECFSSILQMEEGLNAILTRIDGLIKAERSEGDNRTAIEALERDAYEISSSIQFAAANLARLVYGKELVTSDEAAMYALAAFISHDAGRRISDAIRDYPASERVFEFITWREPTPQEKERSRCERTLTQQSSALSSLLEIHKVTAPGLSEFISDIQHRIANELLVRIARLDADIHASGSRLSRSDAQELQAASQRNLDKARDVWSHIQAATPAQVSVPLHQADAVRGTAVPLTSSPSPQLTEIPVIAGHTDGAHRRAAEQASASGLGMTPSTPPRTDLLPAASTTAQQHPPATGNQRITGAAVAIERNLLNVTRTSQQAAIRATQTGGAPTARPQPSPQTAPIVAHLNKQVESLADQARRLAQSAEQGVHETVLAHNLRALEDRARNIAEVAERQLAFQGDRLSAQERAALQQTATSARISANTAKNAISPTTAAAEASQLPTGSMQADYARLAQNLAILQDQYRQQADTLRRVGLTDQARNLENAATRTGNERERIFAYTQIGQPPPGTVDTRRGTSAASPPPAPRQQAAVTAQARASGDQPIGGVDINYAERLEMDHRIAAANINPATGRMEFKGRSGEVFEFDPVDPEIMDALLFLREKYGSVSQLSFTLNIDQDEMERCEREANLFMRRLRHKSDDWQYVDSIKVENKPYWIGADYGDTIIGRAALDADIALKFLIIGLDPATKRPFRGSPEYNRVIKDASEVYHARVWLYLRSASLQIQRSGGRRRAVVSVEVGIKTKSIRYLNNETTEDIGEAPDSLARIVAVLERDYDSIARRVPSWRYLQEVYRGVATLQILEALGADIPSAGRTEQEIRRYPKSSSVNGMVAWRSQGNAITAKSGWI